MSTGSNFSPAIQTMLLLNNKYHQEEVVTVSEDRKTVTTPNGKEFSFQDEIVNCEDERGLDAAFEGKMEELVNDVLQGRSCSIISYGVSAGLEQKLMLGDKYGSVVSAVECAIKKLVEKKEDGCVVEGQGFVISLESARDVFGDVDAKLKVRSKPGM
eukprot:TRINITY_DN1737_c1_g1_i1.p2 TRINITY_DN1737_c1_g1~~TRINITY_DN1737_c1_g1_i1.p2  ORF type:complete len:157 (-),score=53.95 TRINITY_DN1737_c1_g1_i1:825-1295(-)